nr:hypothetical protein [Tanacetum cinerariifolium]
TDGEEMINSIQNGDQPLPVIAQVSLAGNAYHGSAYGEQDRKAAILCGYETFKAIEGEQLLDTYLRYLQVINDLKKCGYKKDNCELNYKFLNNLQQEWKQYATLMRQTKNLMDINIYALYNILKQNQEDVNDALGYKKKAVVVTLDPVALVLSKLDESSSSAEETIAEVAYYTSESESKSECETSKYYDNFTNYGLFVNNDDDSEIFHDAIESASENFIENHIDSQNDYDKSEVDHNDSEEKEYLVDKLIRKFNNKIAKCHKRTEKVNQQSKDFENQNKDLQEKYDVLINQVNTFKEQNNEFNERIKVLNKKNADLLDQTKVLKYQLQVKHVVIDTHVECHEKYAKLKEERYEYMIRYYALCDNDKQHRKKIDEQQILFDKMSVQLVEMDKHVRDLKTRF